ncbi:hypothetical protein HGRIS_009105 [Hohenbuehelia grisea]|uniref:DUF6533 domain-containing protein n=1 Tax=Hohenbuehelia grisea TaxID=104357 RepID=A0ABR3J044_9AGAR
MSSVHDPASIVQSLNRIRISSYLPVSSAGLFLYDYILTFGDELTLVWGEPWSLGKALFVLTRYPAFVDIGMTLYHNIAFSVTVAQCILLYEITGWMFIAGMVIAELILLIRVWALWGRTKRIAALLAIVSVVGIIITAITFSRFHTAQTFILMDDIAPSIPGCFSTGGTDIVFVGYLILMSFEILILVLMLIKGVQHFRHLSSSFLVTFYQDGIMYYAFLLGISIINVVVLLTGPPEYANLLTTLQRTLHSLLSARVLLHLRQSASRRVIMDDGPSEAPPLSSLMFRRRSTRQNQTTQSRHAQSIAWFGDERPMTVSTEDDYAEVS